MQGLKIFNNIYLIGFVLHFKVLADWHEYEIPNNYGIVLWEDRSSQWNPSFWYWHLLDAQNLPQFMKTSIYTTVQYGICFSSDKTEEIIASHSYTLRYFKVHKSTAIYAM